MSNKDLLLLKRYYQVDRPNDDDSDCSICLSSAEALKGLSSTEESKLHYGNNSLFISQDDDLTKNSQVHDSNAKENSSRYDFVRSCHVIKFKDLKTDISKDFDSLNMDYENQETIINSNENPGSTLNNIVKPTETCGKENKIMLESENAIIDDNFRKSPTQPSSPSQFFKKDEIINTDEQKIKNSHDSLIKSHNGIFLKLSDFGISDFPARMLGQICNIQMLYLDSNSLLELPLELFEELKQLRWLDVRNNQLTYIPPTIKGHAALETLLLQNNRIRKLPLELGFVPNLKNLQVAHNPLIFPAKSILGSGQEKIIIFLREKWNEVNPLETIDVEEKNDGKIGAKLSTIICYEIPSKKQANVSHHDRSPESVRQKIKNYKPSNRCRNPGKNILMYQRMLWISCAKRQLEKQAKKLQKIMLITLLLSDTGTLKEWRKSYEKNKILGHKQLQNLTSLTPYALDTDDCPTIQNLVATNINEEYQEIIKLIDGIKNYNISQVASPRSEQKRLHTTIEKITELQRKIRVCAQHNALF